MSRNPKNTNFQVISAESGVAGIKAEIKPIDKSRARVVVSVDPAIKKGPFDGFVTIKTNEPSKPELKVGVRGVSL